MSEQKKRRDEIVFKLLAKKPSKKKAPKPVVKGG